MRVTFEVNGFEIDAMYRDEDVENIFKPLVSHWTELHRRAHSRIVVLLAAAPGTGKTTLSLFLQYLSEQTAGAARVQAIAMDGYHYPNAYLDTTTYVEDGETITLRSRKGSWFTYDVDALREKLIDARTDSPEPWPTYSRVTHDVVPDSLEVWGDVLLIEGNYFLLDEGEWEGIDELADETMFVFAEESLLRERLVSRKVRGGSTQEEGEAWYVQNDGRNVAKVLAHHKTADIELEMDTDGNFKVVRGAELLA